MSLISLIFITDTVHYHFCSAQTCLNYCCFSLCSHAIPFLLLCLIFFFFFSSLTFFVSLLSFLSFFLISFQSRINAQTCMYANIYTSCKHVMFPLIYLHIYPLIYLHTYSLIYANIQTQTQMQM